MKIGEYLEIFKKYINDNYDLNNPLINLKYHHTIRVATLMFEIGERLNLSDEGLKMAFLIGLFHDLGRFEEAVINNKFDNLMFDHAAISNKILFGASFIKTFDIKDDWYSVISKSIYNHNKKEIEGDMSKRELFYSKLIRDADKIDIINLMAKRNHSFEAIPSKNVLLPYLYKQEIDLKDLNTKSDRVLLYLGFANNLYFTESKELLDEYGYLDEYVKSVLVKYELREYYNEIVVKLKRELMYEIKNKENNERGKVYVRKEV